MKLREALMAIFYPMGFAVRWHVLHLHLVVQMRDDFWRKLLLTFLLPLDFLFLLPAKLAYAGLSRERWDGVFWLYEAMYLGAFVGMKQKP